MVKPKLLLLVAICCVTVLNAQLNWILSTNQTPIASTEEILFAENNSILTKDIKISTEWERKISQSSILNLNTEEKKYNYLAEENSSSFNSKYFACAGTGSISYQQWNSITGTAVSNLTSNANYPNNPSVTGTRTLFEMPLNIGNNLGVRMNGYIYVLQPPVYIISGLPAMQAGSFG